MVKNKLDDMSAIGGGGGGGGGVGGNDYQWRLLGTNGD